MPKQAAPSELLLLGANDAGELRAEIDRLGERATGLEPGDLRQLAAQLWHALPDEPRLRAAVVASSDEDLGRSLDTLVSWLAAPPARRLRAGAGAFLGAGEPARIGFLFPGQGARVHADAGALAEAFEEAAGVYADAGLPDDASNIPDDLVQLAVVTSSIAGLRVLRALGIDAELALGHSLGELTALHWAGALEEAALQRIARARGDAMVNHAEPGGAMASVVSDADTFYGLVAGTEVTVACLNSPRQRAISGTAEAVDAVVAQARPAGARAMRLAVTGAFHSPLMQDAIPVFAHELARERFEPPSGAVLSSVTGGALDPAVDVRDLLLRQLSEPVRFVDAAAEAGQAADVLIEVGPGKILAGLVSETIDVPTVSMRVGTDTLRGLQEAAGAAHAAGAGVRLGRLFESAGFPLEARYP